MLLRFGDPAMRQATHIIFACPLILLTIMKPIAVARVYRLLMLIRCWR